MMANDLDAIISLMRAMPVMKIEAFTFPGRGQGILDVSIVIAGDQSDIANFPQTFYQQR